MNDRREPDVRTLLEALPYIREFHGRTVVIKYGGAAMREEELREGFATDVVLLKYVGLNPVIVHGGGPDITSYMERLGMEVRFVEGVRVSDPETVEVAKMVLLGKVNSDIVSRLNRHGQPAVGLSGEDGTLFEVRPHPNADQVGFVGEVERVDVDVLNHIAEDYIPVVASAGTDREGNSYNVNADTAAGKVAAALRAHKAIFLTDVPGWLADPDDPGSLVSRATVSEVAAALGEVEGGMRPKLGGLHRGDRRRRAVRPHHRRLQAPLAASGAVHGRGHRHHGHGVMNQLRRHPPVHQLADSSPFGIRAGLGVGGLGRRCGGRSTRSYRDFVASPSQMSLAELQALEARYAMPTYARAPVEFVRGDGRPALGRGGQGVPGLLRRALGPQRGPLPPADRRRDLGPGGAAGGRLQPLLHGAGDAALRAARRVEPGWQGLSLQLGRGGERVRDQAGPKARPPARCRRARDRRPRARLPRPHAGDPGGDSEARPRGPLRTAPGGLRRRAARRPRRAPRRGRRAHRRGDHRADPGRGGGLPDRRRGAARCATRPAMPRARCSSSTRSRPGWGGPDRSGPTSSSPCVRT